MKPIIPFVSDLNDISQQEWLDHLHAALPDFKVVKCDGQDGFTDTKVAIVANPDPKHLQKIPTLQWVHSLWAGVENLVNTLPDSVRIVRMTDPQLAKTMAEAVITTTLYLHRDFPKYAAQQAQKIWQQHSVHQPEDRTVAVLGLGKMGETSCHALTKQGFNVIGWSKSPKHIDNVHCYHGEHGLDQILSKADIFVVLLPITDTTRNILNKDSFALMKKGAQIINFGRGPIMNTPDLLNALQSGHLKHAVLDVFDTEPLSVNDALWNAPNITILPHISAPTNMDTASKIVAKNIYAFFETGRIPAYVDRKTGY